MSTAKPVQGQILIVTQAFDPHADELIVLLRYMGQEPIRLNTEAIPANSRLSYTIVRGQERSAFDDTVGSRTAPQEAGSYTLFIDGRQIEAERIRAVWWRRPAPYQFAGDLQPEEARLATIETELAMQGFWLALNSQDCYWISAPSALTIARNLPEQFRRARSFGFATPYTLVTTRAGQAHTFYEETEGQMVYRMLSSLVTSAQSGQQPPTANATRVHEEMLASLEGMVSVPCLFHEHLPARRFWVVVVIGNEIFAAQTTGTKLMDEVPHWWSPQVTKLSYEPLFLPDRLKERCRAFVRSYGLEFGVMQLALGPREEIFFASLDPVGSFLWLEMQCPDLNMSETLASRLIAGTQSER